MTDLVERYRAHVLSHGFEEDPAQLRAVSALQQLATNLNRRANGVGLRNRMARLLFAADDEPIKGVYLWGGVGRGKTFIMDLFYESLPFTDKLRLHFHRFMNLIHADLREYENQRNPIELVAEKLSSRYRIICFDEFFVSDIADAMLLGNLFRAVFSRGVSLVATSNVPPSELYKEGLQRARFLPAIEQLEQHTSVLQMDGDTDYRLRVLERADLYLTPIGQEADARLAEFFAAIAPDEGEVDVNIEVLGRPVAARRAADGVIWFDFPQVLDGPRSQVDYIELSRCYQTVLISNLPRFDVALENQARRFIALIDEFYDRRVKLMVSAAVPMAELYAGRKLAFEFQRTLSRLQEMQSHDYLASRHIP